MTDIARGQVWEYRSISHSRRVLVVSNDALNGVGYPVMAEATPVRPRNPALLLLCLNLGPDLGGYARAWSLSEGDPKRFETLVGAASDHLMDQFDAALRATLAL